MNKNDVKELTLYKEDYPEYGWLEICEALNIPKEIKEVTIECKVKSAN